MGSGVYPDHLFAPIAGDSLVILYGVAVCDSAYQPIWLAIAWLSVLWSMVKHGTFIRLAESVCEVRGSRATLRLVW